jgi:DNA-binding NtrC family response regulator
LDELVGISPAIQRVRDQVSLAARGKTHVLIQGPTGSGREHVARLLHRRATPDASEPLVPLWCPLLDAELIQSTVTALMRQLGAPAADLAGSEQGATLQEPTLLLLDVDQLPPDAQAELAGFLTLPGLELYTIATSGDPLLALAEQGRFRADLAQGLSTLVIEIPPLSARPQDIPLLCQCLVERFNARGGRQLSGFTSEALDELSVYPWPENVDELAAVVEQACQAADGPFVEPRQLPDKIHWAQEAAAHPRREEQPIVLAQFLEEIEKELIVRALKRAKGNKTKAARLLGVTRARFHRRLEHFGVSS